MRLLVIEDNRELAALMTEQLHTFGFVCDSAHDGETADQKIHDTAYDAALLDLNLPEKLAESGCGYPRSDCHCT